MGETWRVLGVVGMGTVADFMDGNLNKLEPFEMTSSFGKTCAGCFWTTLAWGLGRAGNALR